MRQMKHLVLFACLLLGACGGTSYKVAPSNAKVATKLATARRSVQQSQSVTTKIQETTQRSDAEAGKSIVFIDAALDAILRRDYDGAVKELTNARASVVLLKEQLQETLRDTQSLKDSHAQTDSDLVAAEVHAEAVDRAIETVVLKGAKNESIVARGEWGFGTGYFIVGIQRILEHAFWGSLILIGVAIVIVGLSIWVGGPMLKGVKWAGGSILNWWKTRKQ